MSYPLAFSIEVREQVPRSLVDNWTIKWLCFNSHIECLNSMGPGDRRELGAIVINVA